MIDIKKMLRNDNMGYNEKPISGKNKPPHIQKYETYAVLDEKEKLNDSQVTIPTLDGVKRAKDWVDRNEL